MNDGVIKRIIVKGIVSYGDKFLIVQRWIDDNIVDPYRWMFLDGDILSSESPDDAIIRIIYESCSIDVTINEILYTWNFNQGEDYVIGIAYHCLADSDMVMLSEDILDYRWVSKTEFTEYISDYNLLKDIDKIDIEPVINLF